MLWLDFTEVKANCPILDVAQTLLGLGPFKDEGKWHRGSCPHCADKRSFTITPNGGKDGYDICGCHRCHKSNDVISLVKELKGFRNMGEAARYLREELGGTVSTYPSDTVPPRNSTLPESETAVSSRVSSARGEGGPKPSPQATSQFDPEAFLAKLEYTDRVSALGIDEEQAKDLGIGVYRGKLYQALRYGNGQIAGFSDGEFKLPKRLIPQSNVVKFPKSA